MHIDRACGGRSSEQPLPAPPLHVWGPTLGRRSWGRLGSGRARTRAAGPRCAQPAQPAQPQPPQPSAFSEIADRPTPPRHSRYARSGECLLSACEAQIGVGAVSSRQPACSGLARPIKIERCWRIHLSCMWLIWTIGRLEASWAKVRTRKSGSLSLPRGSAYTFTYENGNLLVPAEYISSTPRPMS